MYVCVKPTVTVYPCSARDQFVSMQTILANNHVWLTWELLEREHFSPTGLFIADFAHPLEVDPAYVKNHRYLGAEPNAQHFSH